MTGSAGVVDFFALEASEYLEQLDTLLAAAGGRAPDAEPFARNARALRGAATMARHAPLADLAAAIEGTAAGLRDRTRHWSPALADALVAAVDAYKTLVRRVRDWSDADAARAAERAAELRGLAAGDAGTPRPSVVVPIATLFHDDAGPHVVHRNPRPPITADLRFRQAAVPLASTLRRLIGDARHATDEAAQRAVGEDLRAALRDLGELAESYDIRAVVNFARAREGALHRLEERTLDIVDAAAQALVESAGTVWARPTPPASVGVIAPPAPPQPVRAPEPVAPAEPAAAEPVVESPAASAAPPEPAAEPARPTPPSGRALVALLETSITGLTRFGAEPASERPAASSTPAAEAVVPIDTLLYRGRAALDRARQLRDTLRDAPSPDPVLLAELYDLLDLAALDEPARA